MKKCYRIADQNNFVGGYHTKAEAQKLLARIAKNELKSCRAINKRCTAVGSAKKGDIRIKIGGRQGAHLWQRLVINNGCR